MPTPCEPAVLEFPCAASSVWQALCDPSSYEKWYGFPNPRALVSVEPEFALGAKLTFETIAGSTVVTEFRPGEAITLSTGAGNDEFTLCESERGCRVTLVTSLNGHLDWHGTAKAKSRSNKEILRALRKAVCGGQSFESESEALSPPPPQRERGLWQTLVTPLFYGYKNPLKRRRSTMMDDSLAFSSLVDNTESDIVIHLRALFAGLLLAALLFCVLGVCGRFESPDVVTSSGLSVVESDLITLQSAQNIYIGQTKNELELMLSCRGTRLSSTEFVYYSAARDTSGASLYEIYVTYDAYGNVRRFGYVDRAQCSAPLRLAVGDYTAVLDAGMTPAQAAEALGAPLSAYWHDKSGLTTLYFGVLDLARSLYDQTLTAELVVTLAPGGAAPVDTAFYTAFSPRNPMPFDDLNKQYRRQYSNLTAYRADRAAYERIFLIAGLTRKQVDALLGTEQVEFAPTVNSGLLCSYQTRGLFAVGEEGYRYCYNVTYDFEDVALEVSMQNGYLETRSGTLLNYDSYAIYEGATLYELYSTMGLLPTYAVYNGDALTLCYGQRADGTASGGVAYLYDLTVVLDAASLTVRSYSFNHV